MSVNKEYWEFTDYSQKGLLAAINNHKLMLANDPERKEIIGSPQGYEWYQKSCCRIWNVG